MDLSPPFPGSDSRDADLEYLTHAYGHELFARLDRRGPLLFSPRWFDERLMEWTMAEEAVKLQLFRFIDVLPMLKTAPEVSRHLREYFTEAREALPAWARFGVRWIPNGGVAGRLLATVARSSSERMARRFIAGSHLDEALQTIHRLRGQALAFTVDLLGEATITEVEAEQYQQACLQLIEGLSRQVNHWPPVELIDRDPLGPLPRVNVSVKLSSLYSQFDPIDPTGTSRAVRERLRPLFRAARRQQAFLNFDMEQYAYKDATLQIFREILEEDEFRDWSDVGIAIQTYLRDSDRDLQELAAWSRQRRDRTGASVCVRLIKGAYWDFETVNAEQQNWPVPVFTDKGATDTCYERLSRFLLTQHEVLRPAFGSHNIRSVAHVLALADVLGLSPRSYEIQMLYGMAEPVKAALVSLGRRVRVYTPYGQLLPGMAYLVRRLLENTANESFLRASFTEHVPEEVLLMKPHANGSPQAPRDDYTGFRNESVTDFSREVARQQMTEALAAVKNQFGQQYPLVIGQQKIPTEQWTDSLNPSRIREIVGRCGRASASQARDAIAAAWGAFPAWRDLEPDMRAAVLRKAAAVLRRRRFELAAWQIYECGKQWREADADVAEAIDFCEYYAQEMIALGAGRSVNLAGEENVTLYEGRGVCVVIAPWNFPLAILTGMTAAALVTGNTVVMKPAEQSSVMAAKLMEVFEEIGPPGGVVNYLPGVGEEIGPTLVNHPDVAMIAFTGSRNVGLLINREAAVVQPAQDHIKRVLAELGGKNAIIVDEDADLDEAVHGVVGSAFGYQGQKCSACSRVIVLASLHDAFLQRLIEATRSLILAAADAPGCGVGPVIDEEARKRILDAISKGKQEARLAYAGDVGQLQEEGYYVGPHIFADVAPTAALAQEEIFGPVLAVLKAADLDEALAIANGTTYALTGGLYSRSPTHIRLVKKRFRVGNLYINRKITGAQVNRQPFGGFKMSGIGSKAGGPDYLLQFLVPRTITENTMRRGFAPGNE